MRGAKTLNPFPVWTVVWIFFLTLCVHLLVPNLQELTIFYTTLYLYSTQPVTLKQTWGWVNMGWFHLFISYLSSNKSQIGGNLSYPNLKEIPKRLLVKELFWSTLSLPYCSRSQFILIPFTVKMSRTKAAQSQVLTVPSFLWAQSWGVWVTAGNADSHWCWPWAQERCQLNRGFLRIRNVIRGQ